jgi:hypothetical protein
MIETDARRAVWAGPLVVALGIGLVIATAVLDWPGIVTGVGLGLIGSGGAMLVQGIRWLRAHTEDESPVGVAVEAVEEVPDLPPGP